MKKSFFILILCLSSFQAGYIKGFIMSENLDTLAGANISISNLQLGTASMSDGSFILEGLDIGKYTINVNYIGYKQTSLTFYISEFSSTDTFANFPENKLGFNKYPITQGSCKGDEEVSYFFL